MKAKGRIEVFLPDESATLALGAKLGALLRPGMYVALHGDLGSGKTTLARGMLRGLGYHGRVKSPTYTLVELYKLSRLDLYHFDFYRFADPHEFIDSGLREAFSGEAACIAEWPERAAGFLPLPDLSLTLSVRGQGREAVVVAESETGRDCLQQLTA